MIDPESTPPQHPNCRSESIFVGLLPGICYFGGPFDGVELWCRRNLSLPAVLPIPFDAVNSRIDPKTCLPVLTGAPQVAYEGRYTLRYLRPTPTSPQHRAYIWTQA